MYVHRTYTLHSKQIYKKYPASEEFIQQLSELTSNEWMNKLMNERLIEILTNQEEKSYSFFDLEENKTCLVVQEYTYTDGIISLPQACFMK